MYFWKKLVFFSLNIFLINGLSAQIVFEDILLQDYTEDFKPLTSQLNEQGLYGPVKTVKEILYSKIFDKKKEDTVKYTFNNYYGKLIEFNANGNPISYVLYRNRVSNR